MPNDVYRFTIKSEDLEGSMTFFDPNPVQFMDYLRVMFGKRVTSGVYDPFRAMYKGNVLTTVTLTNCTWADVSGKIVRFLIPGSVDPNGYLGKLTNAEVRALNEAAEGGLHWAIRQRIRRETGFANVYFWVKDENGNIVHKHVCQDCIGGFMEWSNRGWSIVAWQDGENVLATTRCDLCGEALHKEDWS